VKLVLDSRIPVSLDVTDKVMAVDVLKENVAFIFRGGGSMKNGSMFI